MNDRSLLVAALIVGGAIITSSFQTHERYSLSAAGNNIAWRMDTWSGNIDICAAAYPPTGPVVRCGVVVVTPPPEPAEQEPGAPTQPPAPATSPRDHI